MPLHELGVWGDAQNEPLMMCTLKRAMSGFPGFDTRWMHVLCNCTLDRSHVSYIMPFVLFSCFDLRPSESVFADDETNTKGGSSPLLVHRFGVCVREGMSSRLTLSVIRPLCERMAQFPFTHKCMV